MHTSRALATVTLTMLLLAAPATAAVPDGTPDDPFWEAQWGPRQVAADQAWPTTTGAGTTIAVLDCGIDLDHPDLAANVAGGYDATTDGGDGDWDPDGDDAGCTHGTHVAGIAGAVGDNGVGIVGVAPDSRLLAVRVLGDDGSGSFEDIAEGVRWATQQGADVINMSLGAYPGLQLVGEVGADGGLREALAEANAAGVVVVAAAGNESFPVCSEPAFAPGVLCVSATDQREAHSWYSNGGIDPELLAVAAPGGAGALAVCGEEILSTVPVGTSLDTCGYGPDHEELLWFGTSMATPHAAGAAAMLAAMGCDRAQTLDLLTSTARTPLSGDRGVWDPLYGYGIVDAAAAVGGALATCEPPVDEPGPDDGTQDGGDPVATNDATVNHGEAQEIDVLANDEDPDGEGLTITEVSAAEHGEVSTDGRTVMYTPPEGFRGDDTFTYTVSDGDGGSDTATVTVRVRPRGEAPDGQGRLPDDQASRRA